VTSPIESLLGAKGELPECKVFNTDVAVHWFPSGAKKGERCLCGARELAPTADEPMRSLPALTAATPRQ
jgi:hypothetical protein